MNHTLLGAMEERLALLSLDHGPASTDWCVGGCDKWSDTKEGQARYNELAAKMREYEENAAK